MFHCAGLVGLSLLIQLQTPEVYRHQPAGGVGQLVWLRIRVGCWDGPTSVHESCPDALHD